mgnify:CR=1 FL=1
MLLRDIRRALKTDGIFRLSLPDAKLLYEMRVTYCGSGGCALSDFDELNEGCANALTPMGKLRALLWEGHQSVYDWVTLRVVLEETGFVPQQVRFRETGLGERGKQVVRETMDVCPEISLLVECTPKLA